MTDPRREGRCWCDPHRDRTGCNRPRASSPLTDELGCLDQGVERDADLGEVLPSASLTVDDGDHVGDLCTVLAEGLDGLDAGSGGGDNILHHQDLVPGVEVSLDQLSGTVVLLLLPDHDVGDTR